MTIGFDAPVGTNAERAGEQMWPGAWFDATGYAVRYPPEMRRDDWHTGADLNLNEPHYNADARALCFACADGVIVAAGTYPLWGKIAVIRHDGVPEIGTVWSRYAHLESLRVQTGEIVTRGQPIGTIGNAEGRTAWHLHYDLARVDLGERPTDWPGTDIKRLRQTYFDPRQFILEHRALHLAEPGAQPTRRIITAEPRLRIRKEPNYQAAVVGYAPTHAVVITLSERQGWALIADPVPGWIDLQWTRLVGAP